MLLDLVSGQLFVDLLDHASGAQRHVGVCAATPCCPEKHVRRDGVRGVNHTCRPTSRVPIAAARTPKEFQTPLRLRLSAGHRARRWFVGRRSL